MRPYRDCSIRHVIQVYFLGLTIISYLDFLFVSLSLDVRFSLFFRRIQLLYVGLPWGMTLFYVPSLLLVTEYGDNSFGRWYLHAQKLLSYDCVEFVHEASAENRESFCSGVVKIFERYWKRYFSNWLD
jgi:hypothetical protein